MSSNVVLFLRSPSTDTPDRYESTFSSAGYTPISIPVLKTETTNVTELARIILRGPGSTNEDEQGYSGVITTSARACEAWKIAVEGIAVSPSSIGGIPLWSTIPFYVVGPSTASSLSSLHSLFSSNESKRNLVPSPDMIRGQESGNGEELARFILRDLAAGEGVKKRLLYLTGDKNRDTIPSILSKEGGRIELNSVKVYETRGSSTFKADLEKVVLTASAAQSWWIVFFAPSAAQFVVPVLEECFDLPRIDGLDKESMEDHSGTRRQARLAAIGPTTLAFLRDALSLCVSTTASKPNPEDLLLAIRQAEQTLL